MSPNASTIPLKGQLERLKALVDLARMLASELSLPEIIHHVLIGAIEVIPSADAGTLYLYDKASGKLRASDSVGLGEEMFSIALEPGEGAAGIAFRDRCGYIYPNPESVWSALRGASDDTLNNFSLASNGRSPKGAMSAPLIFKGECLGALIIDAIHRPPTFERFDLQVLDSFAQIAAVAIINARLFETEHTSRVRLEVLNHEITRERDELDRRLRALDALAEIAREGLPLEALAARLARVSAGQVHILDSLSRTRIVEPLIEDRPEELDLDHGELVEILRRTSRNRSRERVVTSAGCHMLVCPVMAGHELLGFVLLDTHHRVPDSVDEAAADSAGLIVAARFMHEKALEEGEFRTRAELLTRLLDGVVPASAASLRSLPPPLVIAVGGLVTDDGRSKQPNANVFRTFRTMVQESIRGGQDPCVACVRGDYVIVGWSMAERTHELDVKSVLDRLVDQFDRTGTGWLAYFAVADPVEDLQAVPHVFDEARLALEIWRDGEARERVFRTGHLGAYRLIIGAATGGSAVQLSARTLGKVIEQDGRSGGKILPTFRSYLANNFSVTQTARALGVHVHTVQYRLHQLEALTGLRLRNAEERLTLELAVRIVDLSAAGSRDVEAPDRRHGPSRQPG